MKKLFFCLVPILFFACASPPPSQPGPAPSPQPAAQPASPPPASTPAQPPRAVEQPARTTDLVLDGASTYVVVRGDTLSNISRSKYNNGFYYPLIMMASQSLVKDQDLIEVGWALTVPVLQANLNDPRAVESIKKFIEEIARITEPKRPLDAKGLRALAASL